MFLERQEIFNKITEICKDNKKNICVIFGAGASYGYTDDDSFDLPPIVFELFNESNPVVQRVINLPAHEYILSNKDYLTNAIDEYNGDLEEYLSNLYNNNENHGRFIQILLYLQDLYSQASNDVNWQANNYKLLFNRLCDLKGSNPWSCITFNYDTILEKSFGFTGIESSRTFENYDHYENNNPKIIKVHGGINFRYVLSEDDSKNNKKTEQEIFNLMMNGKKDIGEKNGLIGLKDKIPNTYEHIRDYETEGRLYSHVYNLPLIMIPIHGTYRSKNEFFNKMISNAALEVSKSKLVVAIGYNFGDNSFTDELKKYDLSNTELILVGTQNLVEKGPNHNSFINALKVWDENNIHIFLGNGFGEFVDAIIKRHSSVS